MFGVSPAFVFSLYGTGFTVPDFCDALPRIRRLGFDAFQPEIYVRGRVPEWLREAGRLQRIATDLGLVPTQFVAHFMLEWFASPERLGPDQGLDDLKRVIEVVARVSRRAGWSPSPPASSRWSGAPPRRRAEPRGGRCGSA